ncbi:hypothetical protein [Methylobacter tundripaludum]|uniref:hypothetical protein n=1 Tax=Methylobacter tundripaludum TaxID=173365 RepID=UPI0004856B77|nr:hypothetical protein [Methylobacter tundripaludum]
MISMAIVISYDDDSLLDSYFSDCANHVVSFLKTTQLEITEVTNNQCNSAYFDIKVLPLLSNNKSILIIFSHGNDNSFLCNGTPFLESEIAIDNINNIIIYTNSCSTGKVFGKAIDISGGTFIGYEADVRIPKDLNYRRYFVECDNWGIFCLFNEKIKLVNLRQAVKVKFNQHIDTLCKTNGNDFFIASLLREARDNFVVLGQNLDRTII